MSLNGEGIISEGDKRWYSGEPDSRGGANEDCTAGDKSGWHDRECDSWSMYVICERPVAL